MSTSFADKVIESNALLNFSEELPEGFQVLNPYSDNRETVLVMQKFYRKYYNDSDPRKLILGINPSRHGAAVTGVPFTDTKRLESVCGIKMNTAHTHEISSLFMYDMIAEYGGASIFYKDFYINSPFPLAIIQKSKTGKLVNANYYDDPRLFEMLQPFMIDSLKKHISLGIDTSEVFVLGLKNARFIQKINLKANLFTKLTVLEHPRYIQQYKSKDKQFYLDKFVVTLANSLLDENSGKY